MSIDIGAVRAASGVISLVSNERCKHELIRRQCGYCRTPPLPAFVEAVAVDPPNNVDDGGEYVAVSPLFAPSKGYCASCDSVYAQGERIYTTQYPGDHLCSDCAS